MKNKEGRLLALGDIHGCYNQLKAVIDKIKPTQEDKIVFLGDYIDRGPNVRGVIEFLIKFKKKFPKTVLLKGNHESIYLDALSGMWDAYSYIRAGGMSTLNSYPEGYNKVLIDFIDILELYHETEDYIFVHAGLMPCRWENIKKYENIEDIILWVREDFLRSDYDWGKIVVHGHTPMKEVVFKKNRISIDTGCVFEGVLSAIDLTNNLIYSSDKYKVVDNRAKSMYN